ncbi:MAG: PspA/IM30 family protein [Candidatus Marinimicrobia bacterium]|nr:PspA/IM30 family protein [Candidatus Neomarinimicrobiota bacterium]
MSLWSRILLIFKIKTSAAIDRAEDPLQVLDYAYGQQHELLRKVKQGLVEVATSKQRLEQQFQKQHARVPWLEDQAKRAVAAGREDLARVALQRKQTAIAELESLAKQTAEVAEEERKLAAVEQQLSARIEEFRLHREVTSARYTAAEAQVKVKEALTGISGEIADLSMALGRAEEKTERMLARASAIDGLIDSGSLELPTGGGDLVERELREITAKSAVEEELAALKAEQGQLLPPSGDAPGDA